jgi:peptidoglycan/xylan/chitin deacetylase (PgdA/CDA1 family)
MGMWRQWGLSLVCLIGILLLLGRESMPLRPHRSMAMAMAMAVEPEFLPSERGVELPDQPAIYRSTRIPPVSLPVQDRVPVPVLMYHEIGFGPNNLYLSPQDFASQLDYLQAQGFHAVTLERLWRHFTMGEALPSKPIVLTFDDGYASFVHTAMPLLKAHDYPGTVFVITGMVGKPSFATWDELRAADRAGMEIGSHTVNHLNLTQLDPDRLQTELGRSKLVIEEALGHAVHFFCYPSGRHNDLVVKQTALAGYEAAVTTESGLADQAENPFRWKRVRVSKGESAQALEGHLRALGIK